MEAQEKENAVRFAVLHNETVENREALKAHIYSKIPDAIIELLLESIKNPVLSKLKVNQTDRYI